MGSEQYCLRWNDFQTNITNAFSDIRDEEDFLDVTLVSDGQTIRAHKLVLSACSPMFKAMLKKNTHPQPMIFLHGVRFNDIAAILNFMYHGEVNVNQEDLQTFLAAAEDLRIRGLSAGDKGADKMPSDERGAKRSLEQSSPGSPGLHNSSISAKSPQAITSEIDLDDDVPEEQPKRKNPKMEPKDLVVTPDLSAVDYHESNSSHQSEQQYNHASIDYGYPYESAAANNTSTSSYSSPQHHLILPGGGGGHMDASKDFEGQSQQPALEPGSYTLHQLGGRDPMTDPVSRMMVARSPKGWHCPQCLHISTTKGNLKSHILSGRHKLFEKSYTCQYCHKNYSTRQSLQVHISTHHRHERDREFKEIASSIYSNSPQFSMPSHSDSIAELGVRDQITITPFNQSQS